MKSLKLLACSAAAGSFFLMAACDWTTGGENDFNSTREANTVNHSGFFSGSFTRSTTNVVGGVTSVVNQVWAVANSSGRDIATFAIIHSGNSLEVVDNNGSTYRGRNGSPLAVAARPTAAADGDGAPPIPDAVLATANQIWWEGTDKTSGLKIEFIGIMNGNTLEGTWYEYGGRTSEVSAERAPVVDPTPDPVPTP